MRRRDFILAVGSTVAAWPLTALAQQQVMPVIGLLSGQAADKAAAYLAIIRQGLRETGYVEGRNVVIEYRWAENQYDRLPALAADLVSRRVSVIVATAGGGTRAALAAKAATTTIPIVFTSGADPVTNGLVVSLNRPGGNVTGVAWLTLGLDAKRLELLHKLVPQAARLGALLNPHAPDPVGQVKQVQEAARAIGLPLHILRAATDREIDAAFEGVAMHRISALLVGADPFFASRADKFVALAARHAIPAMYETRNFTEAGGLMSYGASRREAMRQAGIYTGRVLNGEKPADLPVLQPTSFELVINLKTARALGLQVPPTLIARADELIE